MDPAQQLFYVAAPVVSTVLIYKAGKRLLSGTKRKQLEDSTTDTFLFPKVPIPPTAPHQQEDATVDLMKKVEDLQKELQQLKETFHRTFLTSQDNIPPVVSLQQKGADVQSLPSEEESSFSTRNNKRIRPNQMGFTMDSENTTQKLYADNAADKLHSESYHRIPSWESRELRTLLENLTTHVFTPQDFRVPILEATSGATVLVCGDAISSLAFAMMHFTRCLVVHRLEDLEQLKMDTQVIPYDGVIFFDFTSLSTVESLLQTTRNVVIKHKSSKDSLTDVILPKNLPRVFLGRSLHEALGFNTPHCILFEKTLKQPYKLVDLGSSHLWKKIPSFLETYYTIQSNMEATHIEPPRRYRQTRLEEWPRTHPKTQHVSKTPTVTLSNVVDVMVHGGHEESSNSSA